MSSELQNKLNYISRELEHVSPLPPDSYVKFGFMIQIVNGETGKKTKYLNITPEQFSKIENILYGTD